MPDTVNYPDLLGLITGGPRVNLGVIQAALATRPRIGKAGRPFEVILLLQSAADVDVDVMTTLYLPEQDSRKRRSKFITKTTKLLIGVGPAEVGYVVLPASTQPDTAPGDDYRIAVEVDPRPLHKPQRVRLAEGGGPVQLDQFAPAAQEKITALKALSFSTSRKLATNRIEVPFPLMSGGLGQLVDFKPGWVSVATLADYKDSRPLLHRFGDTLIVSVLPQLKRTLTYPALKQTTAQKFAAGGWTLHECEIVLIAKLLTLLLDYASPNESGHGYLQAGRFGIKNLIEQDPLTLTATPELPRWATSFLTLLEREPRAAAQPLLVIQRLLFDDLLDDAIRYGFELLEQATGEDFGTPAEMNDYAAQLIAELKAGKGSAYSRLYLPLILGGVLISERVPVSKETPAELLAQIARVVEQRQAAASEEEAPIFTLADTLIARTGQKYGFRI